MSFSVLKRVKYRHLGLVWRRHTKFQIGMAAALPAIPLPAPLVDMSTGPFSRTRPDQLMMTPKVEFSKYSTNIFHGVKFVFRNVM